GTGLNEGSKVVIAAAGAVRRTLATQIPSALHLPDGFADPRVCLPGVLAVRGPAYSSTADVERFSAAVGPGEALAGRPVALVVDDSDFAARHLKNWIWMTFTRSNPAADIHGVGAFTRDKHWGCTGPLVIDARIKPHHAPPLEEDAEVSKKVDAMAARGGPLHG